MVIASRWAKRFTRWSTCRHSAGKLDYFRELSQSAGVLRWTGTEIEVHLVPTVNYPPKLRKIIDRVLHDLNQSDLTLPDGSGRKLRRRLTRKEQIEVRVRDSDES